MGPVRLILLGGIWKLVAWGREAVLWFGEEEMGEQRPPGILPQGHSCSSLGQLLGPHCLLRGS